MSRKDRGGVGWRYEEQEREVRSRKKRGGVGKKGEEQERERRSKEGGYRNENHLSNSPLCKPSLKNSRPDSWSRASEFKLFSACLDINLSRRIHSTPGSIFCLVIRGVFILLWVLGPVPCSKSYTAIRGTCSLLRVLDPYSNSN